MVLPKPRPLALAAGAALLALSMTAVLGAWWTLARAAGEGPCPLDNEGAWSIGLFKGRSPFALEPLERAEPPAQTGTAWPVVNPVLTCTSVADAPSSFVADPFLLQGPDGLYLFYETKTTAKRRGEIGVARSTDGGASFQHLGVALSEPWHLSYPFVFEHGGQVYMLPESSGSGKLLLYRATRFPLEWKQEKVLVDRPLVDASIVHFGSQWWMFASDPSRRGARKNGELEIWYSDSPLGPWWQHAANPVKNGARSAAARSGGRPLVYQGKLYRFGQDCGETYGHKELPARYPPSNSWRRAARAQVVAFEVTKLTTTEFEEVSVDFPAGLPSGAASSSSNGVSSDGASSSGGASSGQRLAWDSRRRHHVDVQQVPSGEWIAVMDGDRLPSGSISRTLWRAAGLALGPWAAVLACWAALRVAAARSPAARRLLAAAGRLQRDVSMRVAAGKWRSPTGPGMLSLPLSITVRADGGQLKHKDSSSEDEDVLPEPGDGFLSPTSPTPATGTLSQRRFSLSGHSRDSKMRAQQRLERPSSGLSTQPGGRPAAAAALRRLAQRLARRCLRPQAWLVLSGLLVLVGSLCAAVGGYLYLRPYLLPSHALAVEGQYSQFTLVSMTYDKRMPTLRHMVRHYSRCPSVREIVLVWNKGEPPVPERDFDSAVPVRVRVEGVNSLNNRFKVDPLIQTRAVLSLDDDILMPCSDIERGFAAWRRAPHKMVGYYPRLIEGSPLVFRGEKYSIERGMYNAVLTGAAFLDSWTVLPAYWSEALAPARARVDELKNGEDLLLNMVLANMTRYRALAGEGQGPGQQQQQKKKGAQKGTQQAASPFEQDHAGEAPIQFVRPTRRTDISKLSKVGISRNFGAFKLQAGNYLANFTGTFGYFPLQHLPHDWEGTRPPFCALDFLGCTYL